MKINICLLLSSLLFFNNLKSAELVIKILNIEKILDQFILPYMINQNFFPKMKEEKQLALKKVSDLINNEITLKDLDESHYAVAIYHDKNSNDEFDTFLSIPQEKFGFSNDAKVFFGPPSFDEASFYLKKNQRLKIEISLR